MKKLVSMLVAGSMVTALMGCTETGQPGGITSAQGGTVVGGVLGGLAGTQIGAGQGTTVAIIGGTLLGAFLGNRIGHYMDQQSQTQANQAAQNAMQTGQTTSWQSQTASGVVVPKRTYTTSSGHVCRHFVTTVHYKGKLETVRGIACRNARGVWVVQ